MNYCVRTKNKILERETIPGQNLSDLLIKLCKEFGYYDGQTNETYLSVSLEERDLNTLGFIRNYCAHDIFLVSYTDELIGEALSICVGLKLDRKPISIFMALDNNDKIATYIIDYIDSIDVTEKAHELKLPGNFE